MSSVAQSAGGPESTEAVEANRIAVLVNGQPHTVSAATVVLVLTQLGLDPSRPGIAVAVNHSVVPRSLWGTTNVCDGDCLELVGAVQGG